ncbi:MAG: hypothetical protein BGO43_00255 [Gammaproteobacteria bacterium 39-13]|nr:MAG: hypothetical protein BGO43_00255 [Gammaproteobacteria bacterium 39-13]
MGFFVNKDFGKITTFSSYGDLMLFSKFGKKKSDSSTPAVPPQPYTFDYLRTQQFSLNEINNMIFLAMSYMDPNDPKVFRIYDVEARDEATFLKALDLPNALKHPFDLDNEANATHAQIAMKKQVQEVLIGREKLFANPGTINVMWSELAKALFKKGPVLNLKSASKSNVIASLSIFRNQLIEILFEYYLQVSQQSTQSSSEAPVKINDRLNRSLMKDVAVQASLLAFIGELTKQGHVESARAIHNFIHLVRKAMLANMAKDNEMDAAKFAVFLSPCLVDGLDLKETLMTFKQQDKALTAEYFGFQAFSQIILEMSFFDVPYSQKAYHLLSQQTENKSGELLRDEVVGLHVYSKFDAPKDRGSYNELRQSALAIKSTEEAVSKSNANDTSDMISQEEMFALMQQLDLAAPQSIPFDAKVPSRKGLHTSFLVQSAKSTIPDSLVDVKQNGSLVAPNKSRSRTLLTREVFSGQPQAAPSQLISSLPATQSSPTLQRTQSTPQLRGSMTESSAQENLVDVKPSVKDKLNVVLKKKKF